MRTPSVVRSLLRDSLARGRVTGMRAARCRAVLSLCSRERDGRPGPELGAVLDGIPESFVLGLTVLQGRVLLTGPLVVAGLAASLALSAI